jgi:hypothetical protein
VSIIKKNSFFFLIIIYSFYDRVLWSNISQWQVDEATTMWLGLNYSLSNLPVGLISSQGIPNPNGMMYLSKFLSQMPTLWSSSYILSLIQLSLILILGFVLSKENKNYFLLIILPLILCLSLRSISPHMSNQWVLTLVNLLFFILIAIYINKPSISRLVLFSIPILIAPSIYLSGLSNSFAYMICVIFIFFIYPAKFSLSELYKSILFLIIVISIFCYFVWLPYFEIILLKEINLFNKSIEFNRMERIFDTILNFPYWSIFYAGGDISGTFKHNGLDTIISPFWSIFHFDEEKRQILKTLYDGPLSINSINLLKLNSLILVLQAFISSVIIFCIIFLKKIFKIKHKKITYFLITVYLFIFAIPVIGSVLGSPNWVKGDRLDMQVHLLPFFILVWFLVPWTFEVSTKFDKYFRIFSIIILTVYAGINLVSGLLVYHDHLKYSGKILSDADIPLIQKKKVVDFISKDWKKNNDNEIIQVGYYFTDKRYNWIDRFGEKYFGYYPNVYTRGREFDYIFLKSYGLKNSQEGIQHRSKLNNQYIITYNGSKLAINEKDISINKKIGRLRILKLKY